MSGHESRDHRRFLTAARLLCAAVLLCAGFCVPVQAARADVLFSQERDAAVADGSALGVTGFHKAKRGSDAPLADGAYYGYRYITGAAESCVLASGGGRTVVYVPGEVCERLGIDLSDASQTDAIYQAFSALDVDHAQGGPSLEETRAAPHFTSKRVFELDGYRYRFGIASGGRSYAAVLDVAHPKKSARAASFCDYGALVPASEVQVAQERGPLGELAAFLAGVDWSPLLVSVRTTLVATLFIAVLGVLVAWASLASRDTAKSVIDLLCTVPMVLPPTIMGFILLWVFGKNSPSGQFLLSLGIDVPFTWPAAVIAAVVVAFPYMYRSARAAFEGIDPEMLDAARVLGWSDWRVLRRLALPLASSSVLSGVVLSFARALGEFGATMFFAGNYVGETQTLPIAIYYDWMGGDIPTSWLWVFVVIAFSFASMVAMNVIVHRSRARQEGG